MCDSAALNPDPTSEGASAAGTVLRRSGADKRTGDEEGGEFYCGEEGESDEDDEGARAAALERFDAILQIDAGRFADDEEEEEEEQAEGDEACMKP